MAQISYRANLSTAVFPMTLSRAGRSVIIPGPDQNFDRRVDPQGPQKDASIPQVIYMENVLPTSNGYQSIGYTQMGSLPVSTIPGYNAQILSAVLGSPNNQPITLGLVNVLVYYYNVGVWTPVVVVGTPFDTLTSFTTATVRGVCYVHSGNNLYTLGIVSSAMTLTEITASVLPAGVMNSVVGICGSFNYLLLLNRDGTVYWSSTLSPIDFQPSLITGAGSTVPGSMIGAARFIIQNADGFYVVTERTIIYATYTGNARYPWRFIPVLNTEGAGMTADIASTSLDSFPYLITSSRIITRLERNLSSMVAPEVSELLKRIDYFDVFNSSTNTFSVQPTVPETAKPASKLTQLFDRFVILSRGLSYNLFTEAIIFDLMLNRYGRLKINHSAIFSSPDFNSAGRADILFLDQSTGTTSVLIETVSDIPATQKSVILLGKFQYVRSRQICLDYVEFECGQIPGTQVTRVVNFAAYAIPTLNGKTFLPAIPLTLDTTRSTGDVMSYYSTAEGNNISVLVKGAFDLSSVELTFHIGGSST